MGDFYTEQLVKKRTTMKDTFIKALMVALTIVAVLTVFLFPFGMILPVIFIVADVFIFRRLDVEYEYLYLNGDLDIDKIMHKEKRKHVFSANVNEMEVLAPSGSPELHAHREAKTLDFSTGNQGVKTYEMVVVSSGQKKRIIFEPNEAIVEGVRLLAPRKVVR